MPTGYTAKLYEGEQTFEEFVWICARAFGALVTMREEPLDAKIPAAFRPDTYHAKELRNAKAELERWRAASLKEAEQDEAASYARRVDDIRKGNERTAATRQRYEAMLAKVMSWVPPTPDHGELKAFMVQQLQESLRWETLMSLPRRTPAKEWLASMIANAERDVEYHAAEQAADERRAANRNDWLAALRRSVGDARSAK